MASAHAATFTVTSTSDSVDANTADGTCADSGGNCTLRAAVQQANASAGADTIQVPAGTYTLSIAGADDNAAAGDLDVTDALTITGTAGNPSGTIIQAGTNTANGIDRIFSFNPSGGPGFAVSISGLTLRFGHENALAGSGQNFGGAFDFHAGSDAAGSLSLSNSVIDTNTVADGSGGGIALFNGGTISISGTTLENNQALNPSGGAGMGGAIYADIPSGSHQRSMTITSSTLLNNVAQGSGGAIATVGSNPSAVVSDNLLGVLVFDNVAGGNLGTGSGGGAYLAASPATNTVDQQVDVFGNAQGTNFDGNVANGGDGGGLAVASSGGTATLSHSTFAHNTAGGEGGGIWLGAGSSTVSFDRIAGNTATTGTGLAKNDDPGTATLSTGWWGCNSGPSVSPCDLAAKTTSGLGGGALTINSWLHVRVLPSASPINIGGTSTLTADVLTTNARGGTVSPSDVAFFDGLAEFGDAVDGTVSPASPSRVSFVGGKAAATFTGTSAGNGGASVTLDSQTVPALVTVLNETDLQPSIVESTDPVIAGASGGTGNLTYTVTLANAGPHDVTSAQTTGTLTLPADVTASAATTDGTVDLDSGTGAITWSVGSLASGATAKMTVTVNVSAAAADGSTIQLTQTSGFSSGAEADSSPGNDSTSEATTVQGAPALSATPTSLDFGSQQTGTQSDEKGVVISDTGFSPLHVSSVSLTGPDADQFAISFDDCSAQVLQPSIGGCAVRVRFEPTSGGTKNASLRVTSDSATSPDDIPLTGVGAAPEFSASPASVDFGDQRVGTPSDVQTITITNSGLIPFTVPSDGITIVGPDSDEFGIFGETCHAFTLAASGGSCTVQVRFIPSSTGSKSASLQVTSDAPTSPDTVPLSGNGVQSVLSASPASKDFGDQPKDTESAGQTFTISNDGTAPLNVSVVSLAGADASEFTIDSDGCTGVSLAAASSDTCDVVVKFTPHTVGTKSASLHLVSDGVGGPTDLPLTGRSTQAEVSMDPSSNDFGQQRTTTESAAKAFTLTNVGTGTLHVSDVSLVGADAGEFNLVSNGCTDVAESGTCEIDVSFAPTSTGAKSAAIEITSDEPVVHHQVDVPLTGTGIESQLSITPTSKDFGSLPFGQQSAAQAFTITNPGTAPLDVTSVTVVGTDADQFALVTNGCDGQPLDPPPATPSCEVDVSFAPTSVGSKQASLRIESDSHSSPDMVGLSGTATQAAPTVATGAASALSVTGATLNGTVDPLGADTSYHFEWGTSANYDQTTPAADAGSGNGPGAVSAVLNGLAPDTTYHFRLVGHNSGGTTNGADVTFHTGPAPAPPAGSGVPDTTITAPFGRVSHKSTVTFHLHSSEPGSTFQCSLDGSPFAPCPADYTIRALGAGHHVLQARAVGSGGKVDPTPAVYRFTVDLAGPKLGLRGGRIVPDSKGRFTLSISCVEGAPPCRGSVRVTGPHGVIQASKALQLKSGHHRRVRLTLTAAGLKLLTRHAPAQVLVTVRLSDAAGNTTTLRAKRTLSTPGTGN